MGSGHLKSLQHDDSSTTCLSLLLLLQAGDYAGSCGRCYEVACRPGSFKDGYGTSLDRSSSCRQGEKVIVTITDTCPCNYPSNAYSNTRWCCGDM